MTTAAAVTIPPTVLPLSELRGSGESTDAVAVDVVMDGVFPSSGVALVCQDLVLESGMFEERSGGERKLASVLHGANFNTLGD